jgi:hypothetical protein
MTPILIQTSDVLSTSIRMRKNKQPPRFLGHVDLQVKEAATTSIYLLRNGFTGTCPRSLLY